MLGYVIIIVVYLVISEVGAFGRDDMHGVGAADPRMFQHCQSLALRSVMCALAQRAEV